MPPILPVLARRRDTNNGALQLVEAPRLGEFVEFYPFRHGGEPGTVDKLRWLLAKAVREFTLQGSSRSADRRPTRRAAGRTLASAT
jgi:hypothetical protein